MAICWIVSFLLPVIIFPSNVELAGKGICVDTILLPKGLICDLYILYLLHGHHLQSP